MLRRQLLKGVGVGLVLWHCPLMVASPRLRPKLIWVLLRGGLDGLHTVIPVSDPQLLRMRRGLSRDLEGKAMPLERGFGLHPDLKTLYGWYQQKQLLPIVAVASPQRTRSHFKAQDILESGVYPVDHDSGWLNRAVEAHQGKGLAVAHSVPISLRGRLLAKTWYPSRLPSADEDLYSRLMDLYEHDSLLSARLQEGLATREQVGEVMVSDKNRRFGDLASACGTLMAQADGPDCAMLEMGGWDTHNNQVPRLSRQFKQFDQGMGNLRKTLGDSWSQTVVVVATEFGRTVAENGTRGTDHGTASAMFVAGGAVNGGRVLGQWPGLAKTALFEGRDLMPTSHIQSWIGAVLARHWDLSDRQLARVFPGVPASSQALVSHALRFGVVKTG